MNGCTSRNVRHFVCFSNRGFSSDITDHVLVDLVPFWWAKGSVEEWSTALFLFVLTNNNKDVPLVGTFHVSNNCYTSDILGVRAACEI